MVPRFFFMSIIQALAISIFRYRLFLVVEIQPLANNELFANDFAATERLK